MPQKKTPREKNQLGLLTGMDKDIESAKHDDIMLWVDQNLLAILPRLMPNYFGAEWATHSNNVYEKNTSSGGYGDTYFTTPQNVPYSLGVPRPPFEILSKQWEHPIKDKKDALVGFTDLFVETRYYTMDTWINKDSEYYGATQHPVNLFFEIKTTIQLGQLLRQINLYKMYTLHIPPEFIVVSPDTRYGNTLREQGVLFLEYPVIP